MDKPVWTLEQITSNLVRERIAWKGGTPIAYSFYETAAAHLGKPPGFSAFSQAQREALREIYDLVSDIVPLTFYQVADNGLKPSATNQRMTYYNADSSTIPFWGAASVDGTDPTPTQYGTIQSSEIIVNQYRAKVQGPWEPGDSNPRKLMHEVLHGLGIAHPGAYNGDSALNYENFAEYRQDSHEFTVMSYWLASETGADHVAGGMTRYASTPLLHDIAALHALYGANMTTRTGDTVYGFNATAGRDAYNLGLNPNLIFSIWDAGGIDTLDLSGFNTPSDIDLEQGGFTSAGEMTRNISVAFGAVIENAKGGAGNDTIRGNGAANRLDGGAGDDVLDGKAGADVLVGGGGNDVYMVDDAGDQVVESAGGGSDEVRTVLASYAAAAFVERLRGIAPAGGQVLTGNDLDNVIEGGAGDDVIEGKGGADTLDGGGGADRFVYRAFSDSTSAAPDVVRGFQTGIDKIDLTALGPVLIRWTESAGADGAPVTMLSAAGRAGSLLIRIEGRIGAGDVLADRGIAATPGDDILEGTAGYDLFDAGGGDDELTGKGGDDDLYGGDGIDTAVYAGNRADYDIQTGGKVTVRDLNAANGDEGTDSLDGIERLRFADYTVSLGIGDNNAPQLGQPAMVDQVWADGVAASYSIPGTSFIDLDGQETLSFWATLADGSAFPAWLSFDAATRTFRGTPPVSAIGAALTIRVTATDGFASVFDDVVIGVTQSPGVAVVGTEGADLLEGTFRNEDMLGKGGDDVLRGSAGADRLDGSAGTDTVDYSASPEGVSIDLVTGAGSGGHAEGDLLISIERFTGSAHADRIVAGADANRIDGGIGADSMEGGDGDDHYVVDDAGDAVIELAGGGAGDEVRTSLSSHVLAANVERLTGASNGGQALTGNALANIVAGGSGNDVIDGGAGADTMSGGDGNDIYYVDRADDVIVETSTPFVQNVDEVRTALGTYTLEDFRLENLTGLSDGGQALTGNGAYNVIVGAGGNDVIEGAGNADLLVGGGGADRFVYRSVWDSVEGSRDRIAGFEQGVDKVDLLGLGLVRLSFAQGSDALGAYTVVTAKGAGVQELAIRVDGTIGEADILAETGIFGTAGDDVLDGTAEADFIRGEGGDDRLSGLGGGDLIEGGAGNDLVDGGEGADTMRGGTGDDVFLVDQTGDAVVENAGEGTDEVRTALGSYGLGAYVERLTGASDGGQVLSGNDLANTMRAGSGNDTLYGHGGDDMLYGGAGNDAFDGGDGNDLIDGGTGADAMGGFAGDDLFIVDDGGDTVVEAEGEGTDEVRTALGSYALTAHVEKLTGTSGAGQMLSGNALANVIAAGGGSDVLNGAEGADTLRGGAGDDTYLVDTAGDLVVEASGEGTDQVLSSAAAYGLSAHVELLTGTLDTGQTLGGNDLANTIRAGGGADTLYGEGGNDALYGGAGDDAFNAGAGDDLIDGGTGADMMGGLAGNDLFLVDDAGDRTIEAENEGTDEVRTGLASYALEANVENLTGTSAAGQALTGNDLGNLIVGGMGDDTIYGLGGDDIIVGFGGFDMLRGGAGDDVYAIDAGDTVIELDGEGVDEIRTVGAIFVLGVGLENLRATSDIGHDFRGNLAPNAIIGGDGNDIIRLQDGGGDVAFGKNGVDSFYMGGAMDEYDFLDGGDNRDSLILQGSYNLTLVYAPTGKSSIANIESISLISGTSTQYGQAGTSLYSYDLTLVDDNVAAGALMKINGFNLQAGENFTLDASAESDVPLQVYAGFGVDTFTGGQQGDAFIFGHDGRFGAGDSVNGGGGYDVVYLRGDYAIDFNAAGFQNALTNVESIAILTSANNEFAGGGDGDFDYTITWADSLLAAGATFTVNASRLQAHETFVFDGSQETNGVLRVFAGASADTLTGGGGADQLHGGGGADVLRGGGGADLFRYSATSDSTSTDKDRIEMFVSGEDKIDLIRVDAKPATEEDNEAFAFIGANAFSAAGPNAPGELRAFHVSGDLWQVEGDVNGDGVADLVIEVHVAGQPLTAGDFLL
ncbi:MAG TPA: M10 family metallopeptidase C-terminal domain-containing protein [Allosphingosinicella sp.]|jgi:Ca2+-binding RTX toxin-like protein